MVFPVIIILRSRDYLTEKMQENINIFWGVRGLPRWSRICGKSNTFFGKNLFSMIFILNSVYLYLELPEKVLLRRESLSI